MFKKVLFAVVVTLGGWLLFAFAPQPTLMGAVELPTELAALLAGGVFFLVELLLSGRVPEDALQRISAAITAGVLEIVAVFLGLIPPGFEELATTLLNLLVILLGVVSGVKLLFAGGRKLFKL